MCIFPPLTLNPKFKAALVAFAFIVAGTLATFACSQEITLRGSVAPEVGRLSELSLSAELEKDGSKIPADSILVDVQGDCDYRLYEQSTRVAYVPLSRGTISVKVVAIWFDLRVATQTIERIEVSGPIKPEPDPEPNRPEDPSPDLSALEARVRELMVKASDPFVADKLSKVYRHCSEAIRASGKIKIDYFGDIREYNTEPLDAARSSVNIAVSRTIAYAKATHPDSDRTDWESIFLIPLRKQLDNYDLSDRSKLADVLAAVSKGLLE